MNDTFWALVALFLFIFLLIMIRVPNWIKHHLDERVKRISKELEDARCLREEAQHLLAEYQRKRFESEKEARDIISMALYEAETITADAHRKITEYVEHRNRIVEQKIALAEADALNTICSMAINLATAAAERIINSEIKRTGTDELFKESLQEIKIHFGC